MPQKILSQKNSIIGVVVLLVVLGGGYYFFGPSSDSSETSAQQAQVDPNLFTNPDVRDFYAVQKDINLKDTSFINKPFYKQLKDNTVEIPSVQPTGRPNPFWAP